VVTIAKSDLENQLFDRAQACLLSEGFSLIDAECEIVGHRTLRFFVERSAGGFSIEDCKRVSELLSSALKLTEVMTGPYDLEVSSPGIDRRLRTCADFERHSGSKVKLRLNEKVSGRANMTGMLKGVREGSACVLCEGHELLIPIGVIRKANVIWEDSRGG
jgi:ribosome maturation factor RimP